MGNEYTELLINVLRSDDVPVRMRGRALLDLADQRDELVAVAQDALLIVNEVAQSFDVAIEVGGREITSGEVKERLIAALQKARGTDGA